MYLQCDVCISRLAMDIRLYGTLSSLSSSSKSDQPEPPKDTSSSMIVTLSLTLSA